MFDYSFTTLNQRPAIKKGLHSAHLDFSSDTPPPMLTKNMKMIVAMTVSGSVSEAKRMLKIVAKKKRNKYTNRDRKTNSFPPHKCCNLY